jgi:glycosyltransferase involved in cell wall biosynthesis
LLLFLSRIDPKKNLEALIDALAMLDRAGMPARLVVCGSGDEAYVRGLKRQARKNAVHDRVVWAGFVEGETKADALAAADLFVLPSFSENFGVAPVEALLAGVPCVLGKGVAIAEEVEAAGAGRAVAPSADAVATAVRGMLDQNRYSRSRDAARRLAGERYAPDVMGRKLRALYDQILN